MSLHGFDYIQNRKRTNQFIGTKMVSKAITYELKDTYNFSNAEKLFEDLKEILDEKKRKNEVYNDLDILAFQRAMGVLVRYAPTTKDARYYFNLTLSEFTKPLRTSSLELLLINNLLHVHTSKGEMDGALVILKTALEIGVFYLEGKKCDQNLSSHYKDPLILFSIESEKVLNYHGLEFNSDKTDVQKKKK